ncbi:MAG: ethylbenzene dehydrogenase-related protein [Bacteroidia bacterium]
MNRRKKIFAIMFLLTGTMFSLTYCTKHDQVQDLNASTTPDAGDTLWALKVDAGPAFVSGLGNVWNGSLDPMWDNATALKVNCVVPDLGNNTFTGFIGAAADVTMKALYDVNNIYFLAEWNSPKNVKSAQWYFSPSTKMWAQESGAPVYDINGVQTRPAFIQDQFTMLFNINNSCNAFNTLSCYASCHANVPTYSVDTLGHVITTQNYGGVMRTNGPTEKLDCWRARMLQVLDANQSNDTYIDWGNGAINANQVHSDYEATPFAGGTNRQSLIITGKTTKENVPVWINLNANYTNSAILATDTVNCKFVMAVDSNGVLSYADQRGGAITGTIDPNTTGNDYLQVGSGDGPKCIPGTVVGYYVGSRADVSANLYYTGTGWRLMLKRALKTSDVSAQDVDLSSLANTPFGIGVMFNGADNEHAIKTGMMLSFK